MLTKLLNLVYLIITLPFTLILKVVSAIFNTIQIGRHPLDRIIEKTSLFLSPQIKGMEELEGNKYDFITHESVFYILAVAEEIGGRVIVINERDKFFLSILGEEFEPRLIKIWGDLKAKQFDTLEMASTIEEVQKVARSDVRGGVFKCSNFLLSNAKEIAKWQQADAERPETVRKLKDFLQNQIDILYREGEDFPINEITISYISQLVMMITKKPVSTSIVHHALTNIFPSNIDGINNAIGVFSQDFQTEEKLAALFPIAKKEYEAGSGEFLIRHTRDLRKAIEDLFIPGPVPDLSKAPRWTAKDLA